MEARLTGRATPLPSLAYDRAMSEPPLPTRVYLALRAAGETLASAESLTGGQLAAVITEVPGVSETYLGGVVSYATEVKVSLLGVPESVVEAHGVVSGECAEAMAAGARALTGADWAVSTTGVAGPAEQEGKPVGTVFIGVAGPGVLRSVALNLDGDRPTIQAETCKQALAALEEALGDQVRGESHSLR
jgi:PncC family amidohydrolase